MTNEAYLPTVAVTAAVTFYFSGWLSRLTGLLVALDAVTLGFFTVIGAQKAQLAGLPADPGSLFREIATGPAAAGYHLAFVGATVLSNALCG